MTLGIDVEPLVALIETDIWFPLWIWALFAGLALAIILQIREYRCRRSPVDRLIRDRRFGV